MAIHVIKGIGHWGDETQHWMWHALLELARALSTSPSWNIIDSYGPVTGRIKGDPIGSWPAQDYTRIHGANGNAWFVVQQVNPTGGRPAMECKFQCQYGTENYRDASGAAASYRYEGNYCFQSMTARFCPVGGWDLADTDPDFADPTKAGDNNNFAMTHAGSANSGRWRYILDDDFIMIVTFDTTINQWWSLPCYIAEYNVKSPGQDTVDAPAYLMMCYDNPSELIPQGEVYGFLRATTYGSNLLIGCLDENGVFQEWPWLTTRTGDGGGDFFAPETQPNEWDATLGLDFLEVLVAGMMNVDMTAGGSNGSAPDRRIIGSLKHIWKGWGIGHAGFIDSKQYLTLGGNELCCVIPWDGSSTI